jgi:hypothetical protein
MLVTGCVGSASAAEAPTITIAQPLTGSSTNEQLPLFSGTTSDTLDPVTLDIYAGESATGTPLQTPTMLVPHELGPLQATWEITPETPLGQGQYTAVAEQADEGEAGRSSPVTFTIDTTPPKVSIDAVPSPSKDAEPTLSGDAGVEAGDESTIAVTVYRGSTVGGTVAASEDVTAVGASWSYTTPHLADGTYTAQASQSDEAGNIGTSAAVTFTVDTTPPAVSIHTLASPTKDQTPTLTGGAGVAPGDDAAVTVTIFKGKSATKVQSGSATVNGDEWSYTATHLADGNYTAQAEQSDDAGNVGKSATIAFTIDTTPPAVTINTVSSPTNNPEPTLTGAAGEAPGDDAAVSVTVYKGTVVGGTVINSGAATVTGATWSYKSSHLADGTYTAQAEQSDDVGNVGKSAAVTFTVDTTPPAVSIHALVSPTNDPTPTLTGGTGVAVGDEPVVTVTLYKGKGTTSKLSSGSAVVSEAEWSYTTAHLAEGTYTAQAEQSDDAGNTGLSSTVTFTVDPEVTINAVPTPTKDTEPTLSGTAGTAPGVHQSVTVTIYEGESVAGEVVASKSVTVTGGKWSYTPPHLADGTYTAQALQMDEAEDVGLSAAVTFRVDTTAPLVSIDAVPTPSKDTEPVLTGSAGVALGDEPTVTVTIYEGGAPDGKVAASASVPVSGGAWSYKAPHLADGTYTAEASQSDEAENVGTSSAVNFTVDTTPPAVSLMTPANGVDVNGSRPTFSGAAGHESGDDSSITLTIYEGESTSGSLIATEHIKPEGSHWTTGSTGPALANGVYTAVAEQSDDAGNTGVSNAVTFEVTTVVTLDTSRFVRREAGLFTGPTPSFDGTAATAHGDGESVTVKVYRGASASESPVATKEAALNSSGDWSVGPVGPLADGVYTVQAAQVDSGKKDVVEATFTVDADPPQVTLTSPANGSSTSTGSQAVGGAVGTGEGDLPAITVQLYSGSRTVGAPLQTVIAQASSGAWSTTFSGLSPGTYTAQAEQSDDVGNVGHSEPVTFMLTAPPVTNATPTPSSPPVAAFRWVPSAPHPNEPVTLISTSTDVSSPLTAFAWATSGNSVFTAGESALTTSFATAGAHLVQLQVTDAKGLSSTVAETIAVTTPAPSLIQPFPIVRMAGSYDAAGARISLLTVQAPVGATITVICRGAGCPVKSETVLASSGAKSKPGTVLVTLRRFERPLRAGTVLEIRVSDGADIGKFTRFAIHHNKLPSRQDLCLNPAGTTPIVCPT